MKPRTDTDRTRALLEIQGMAGSLEARLSRMLASMRDVKTVGATNLDPSVSGGGVGDPVGSRVTAVIDGEHEAIYDALIDTAYNALRQAENIQGHWAPLGDTNIATPDPGPGGRWCVSCYRDDGYQTPISDHYRGKRMCRWCGDMAGTCDRDLPPLVLVRMRHAGRRIYDRDISTALKPPSKPKSTKARNRRKRAKH